MQQTIAITDGKISPMPTERASTDEDSTHQYLYEIGQFPLLSREEELELFSQMARGCTEKQDERIRTQGRAAQQRLIECNLRLVVSIAKPHSRKMPLLDLVQEGNVGLMHAIETFDPMLGYRLSTYATRWIRQAILRAIANQARAIRLPVNIQEKKARMKRAEAQLMVSMGRNPTLTELSTHLSISLEILETLTSSPKDAVSLDHPLDPIENPHTLGELLPDTQQEDPFEIVCRSLLREDIHKAISQLTPREQRILTMHYGLEDGQERTLGYVGQHFGVTRERIRQIEERSLRKLAVILGSHTDRAVD